MSLPVTANEGQKKEISPMKQKISKIWSSWKIHRLFSKKTVGKPGFVGEWQGGLRKSTHGTNWKGRRTNDVQLKSCMDKVNWLNWILLSYKSTDSSRWLELLRYSWLCSLGLDQQFITCMPQLHFVFFLNFFYAWVPDKKVRKFTRISKPKLQNKFQSISWKREWLNYPYPKLRIILLFWLDTRRLETEY